MDFRDLYNQGVAWRSDGQSLVCMYFPVSVLAYKSTELMYNGLFVGSFVGLSGLNTMSWRPKSKFGPLSAKNL